MLESVIGLCGSPRPAVGRRLPFDSALKYSAAEAVMGGRRTVLVKGAPERLMPHVRKCLLPDGRTVGFSENKRAFNSAVAEIEFKFPETS